MPEIIGRKQEMQELQRCFNSAEAEFVVVYGRRRVGKTYLIREFFHQKFCFQLTGMYNQPKKVQLSNFAVTLERHSGEHRSLPSDWMEAFNQLRDYIESLPQEGKKLIFIDEMPWLDTRQSNFVGALEWFWNGWGAGRNDLMLIACGSATSWITDKLFADKGGLFNRTTSRIYLHPFTLHETELYLQSKGIQWSRYDIAECYMVMGGIPYYLRNLSPQLSYTANIDALFFKKKGRLWDEFIHLYQTLFSNSDVYIQVVEALAAKQSGMTRNEIMAATGFSDNGNLTKVLKNLADSDFVRVYNTFGKKKNDLIYQLADYYTLFYFRFLKDQYGKDEHFWTHTLDNPKRRTWAGYAFEQICKDHIRQIKKSIGISAVLNEQASWRSKESESGAQIDLLIARRDRVINICEIKFSLSPYAIDKDYDTRLRNKLEVFRQETGTRDALHLTFITTYGVKQNMYSGLVQSEVVMDDLFAE